LGGTLCKIGSPLLSFLLCSLCTPLQEKQKDELFKALVASGKTIDEVMRFIKATGEDKIE